MHVYFLLPAFNEENSIAPLLGRIAAAMQSAQQAYSVIVCNDGSKDTTAAVLAQHAASHPLDILHHKYNRGLGETVRDLFERAGEVSGDDDVLIRMDCDDTHNPATAIDMLAILARRPEIGVVIASRFQPGGGQKGLDGYRTTISAIANLFMRLFFPVPNVREFSCGYRAYRASVIKKAIAIHGNDFIQIRGLGFTCTLEKLIKLWLMGEKFAETPFILRYDQKQSASKMIASITTLGYMVMVVLCYWPFGGWVDAARRRRRGEAVPIGAA